MFAMPCANNSTFELWRLPLMRSATTADSSDSIAPSIAIVSVGESSVRIRSGRKRGNLNLRQPGRNAAEAAADRLDRQSEQPGDGGAADERHDVARDTRGT